MRRFLFLDRVLRCRIASGGTNTALFPTQSKDHSGKNQYPTVVPHEVRAIMLQSGEHRASKDVRKLATEHLFEVRYKISQLRDLERYLYVLIF